VLELKPVSKKVRVWVSDDKHYDVRTPNNAEIRSLSEAKDENGLDTTVKLLDMLGLPAAVTWELDPEYTQKIVEALMPQKKS